MKLYLIRHGDPDYENDCLTALGRRQAEALLSLEWTEQITRIICSPLGRARETAVALSEARSIPVEIMPWLREMDDVTVYSRRRPDLAIWNLNPEILFNREQDGMPESGLFEQRFEELRRGADAALGAHGIEKMKFGWHIRERGGGDIAVFCHLGVGMTLLAYLLDMNPCTIWRSFFLVPSSVTTLLLEEREDGHAGFRVLQMGDISHLRKQNIKAVMGGLQYNDR